MNQNQNELPTRTTAGATDATEEIPFDPGGANTTHIEIDAAGKSSEEITREIQSKIAEQNAPKSIWDLKHPSKAMHALKKGFAWNPLLAWPRNSPCVCGSGQKFKKCHALKLAKVCKVDEAEKLQSLVNLVKQGMPFQARPSDPVPDSSGEFAVQP